MRVLVAGIGNIFLGDDGFGVEVAQRLRGEPLGDAVDIADFGIRGVHLAYELADGRYDVAILIDAVARGGEPGTLYAIEPDQSDVGREVADAHTLTPAAVLAWLRQIGAPPTRVIVIGCEPATIEESIGLSAPVAASVDAAIAMLRNVVSDLCGTMRCA